MLWVVVCIFSQLSQEFKAQYLRFWRSAAATAPILTRGNQATVLVSLQSAILVKDCFCCSKATRGDRLCRARTVRSVRGAAGRYYFSKYISFISIVSERLILIQPYKVSASIFRTPRYLSSTETQLPYMVSGGGKL